MNLLPSPKRRSLKSMLIQAAARSFATVGIFALVWFTLHGGTMTAEVTPGKGAVIEQEVASPATQMLEKHDCWTEEAPKDVTIPGHVVISVKGQIKYKGEATVAKAMDQVFNGTNHGFIVIGFCR